ncbi:MAG TPA: enoyl-CoA hydratase/isomerase family protein [Bordetella sp.]
MSSTTNTPANAAPVLFEERFTDNGMRLGVATLNQPQTLNGLSLDMVDLLQARLTAWAADPMVAAVILQGAGEKAFCAGGDLHSLYRSMRDYAGQGAWSNVYARTFFEREYRLDYCIHTYPKPLLCWGRGIVMGGGVGLMMGASHRVLSTDARVAMPEVGIGLFPDVGGSWMLNRMPGRLGLFLALTGAQLNASDAIHTGLADHALDPDRWDALCQVLMQQPWAGNPHQGGPAARSINDGLLRRAIGTFAPRQDDKPGPLRQHAFMINGLCGESQLEDIHAGIAQLATHPDPWLARAAKTMLAGAPGSVRLSYMLQQNTRLRSLEDVFRMEYIVALHCCSSRGNLAEGIRALLIDKDRQPRWQPATLREADADWAWGFFTEPWPSDKVHPLADLGS